VDAWVLHDELATRFSNGSGPTILGREYQVGVCQRLKTFGANIQAG
jgi:hypothetical protein